MYDALVLGGGIVGLATLESLSRRGLKKIALVERFRLGHEHGSSHGRSRIARGAYHEAVFAKLYREAIETDWARLQHDAETRLLHANAAFLFGPAGGEMERYETACREAGAAVEPIELAEARTSFASFSFPEHYAVLRDASAHVIGAADTLAALERLARERGAEILEETHCAEIRSTDDAVVLETDEGSLETQRLIVAAGAWTKTLVPELAMTLTPVRQTVGYFELENGSVDVGAFPCWIHIGAEPGEVHYGLPQFQRTGVKAARHRMLSKLPEGDDPEPYELARDESELDELREWFASVLSVGIRSVAGSERCMYTMTATEDFRIGALDRDPRIVVGTGLSGHGFKFGPLLGRILSELALDGSTSVSDFEEARARFSV